MTNLNVVNLVGHAGAMPDVVHFPSGSMVCKLPLAVNRGKRDSPPDWFNLEMWGKTADVAGNWVKKGSLIGVKGSLKIETWTDRNTGKERSKPVIRVDRLELLGSRRDTNPDAVSGYSGDSEF